MLKARRSLALSSRFHTYIFVAYLFSFVLFLAHLWWEVSTLFSSLTTSFNYILALITYLYGIGVLVLALFIYWVDKIFAVKEFFFTIARILLVLISRILILYYVEITTKGLNLYFKV